MKRFRQKHNAIAIGFLVASCSIATGADNEPAGSDCRDRPTFKEAFKCTCEQAGGVFLDFGEDERDDWACAFNDRVVWCPEGEGSCITVHDDVEEPGGEDGTNDGNGGIDLTAGPAGTQTSGDFEVGDDDADGTQTPAGPTEGAINPSGNNDDQTDDDFLRAFLEQLNFERPSDSSADPNVKPGSDDAGCVDCGADDTVADGDAALQVNPLGFGCGPIGGFLFPLLACGLQMGGRLRRR